MNNNLRHENQFGFQINNSTEHAVLQFTRDITLGVFTDLSNTFDAVDY